ncbi:hypothetical protein [Thalassomonas haliotis]|uniref:Uncharacterized protein n=1 Tax=Thalassomonas haliotis TaxID=485448 RepID=A0ABY7VKT9_9GAMM|nr:hypothetical protein [Thalassomonas haliotis]WDE13661.1 hypothetical protein H3N35_09620 [Thalassomonas haliotis]
MKVLSYLPLAISLFAATANAGDTTVVFGDRYTFTEADFTFTAGRQNPAFPEWGQMTSDEYVAEFPVRGDNGQTLLFDLDVDVWGNGHQADQALCPYIVDGVIKYREMAPLGDICIWGRKTVPGKDFRYSASVNISCNDLPVGTDRDNRNERLEDYVEMTNTFRGVRLRVDKQGVYDGQCNTMKIVIKPGLNQQIQQIDMDLFFGSPF